MNRFGNIIHSLMRVSTLLRGAWLAVALLHAWLIARRIVSGGLETSLGWVIAVLCLTGVIYCTLKVWKVATVFDADPRRALAFALIVLIGHGVIKAPQMQAEDGWMLTPETVAMLVIAPALTATLLVLLLSVAFRMMERLLLPRPTLQPIRIQVSTPPPRDRHGPSLDRRPPPRLY